MSLYYIQVQSSDVIIELDATVSVTEAYSASVTSNPVADKTTISDNVISNLPSFTLNGVISSVSQPFTRRNGDREISEVTQDMKETIREGELVTFYDSEDVYTNCIITQINLTKNSRVGVDGWEVSLTLKQILLTDSLRISINEEPLSFAKDTAQSKKTLSSNTSNKEIRLNDSLESAGDSGIEIYNKLIGGGGG